MPEVEKSGKALDAITNMTKMMGEDKPGTNILIFVIIIVVAFMVFYGMDSNFGDQGFYQVAGFSMVGMVLYILYQLGSRHLAIKERQENRQNHDRVYTNYYSQPTG